MNRDAEALGVIVRAIGILEAAPQPDRVEIADGWVGLGTSYLGLGAHARARQAYLKALDLRRTVTGRSEVEIISILCALSTAYRYEKLYRESEAALQEARSLLTPDTDASVQVFVLTHLGTLYDIQGRLADAETALRQAVSILDDLPEASRDAETLVPMKSLLPQLWNNLALKLLQRKQYADAEALFAKAVRAVEAGSPLAAQDVALIHHNYSLCLRKLGRKADARQRESIAKAVWASRPRQATGEFLVHVDALRPAK